MNDADARVLNAIFAEDAQKPHLLIQQKMRGDLSRPWPVLVYGHNDDREGEVITGRPDAARLLGFQSDPDRQTIDLSLSDLLDQLPQVCVGMYPVYAGKDGGIFVVIEPVEAADIKFLDDAESARARG